MNNWQLNWQDKNYNLNRLESWFQGVFLTAISWINTAQFFICYTKLEVINSKLKRNDCLTVSTSWLTHNLPHFILVSHPARGVEQKQCTLCSHCVLYWVCTPHWAVELCVSVCVSTLFRSEHANAKCSSLFSSSTSLRTSKLQPPL